MPHKDPEAKRAYLSRPEVKKRRHEYQKQYREKNRNLLNAMDRARSTSDSYFDRNLKSKYGITRQDYDQMLAAQKGLCAICSEPESRKIRGRVTRLMVDHNHITKQIRKLLCGRCNTALGMMRERMDLLENMIAYLEETCSTLT